MITKEEATLIALKYLAEKFSDINKVKTVIFSFEEEDVKYIEILHYIKDNVEDYIGHWTASFEAMEEISWFLLISAKTGEVWGYSTPHGFKHA